MSAQVRMHADGSAALTLRTRGFAQSIHFDLPDFIAQEEYFHLAPMGERTVRLVPRVAGARAVLRGDAFALNAWSSAPIKVQA